MTVKSAALEALASDEYEMAIDDPPNHLAAGGLP